MSYTYDVLGRRVEEDKWKGSGGGTATMRFLLDDQSVYADLDGSNAVKTRYLLGDNLDQLFARITASTQPNSGVTWSLTDRLGSVRDLMDSTQVIRNHLDYTGFGVMTQTTPTYSDRYGYTGGQPISCLYLAARIESTYGIIAARYETN